MLRLWSRTSSGTKVRRIDARAEIASGNTVRESFPGVAPLAHARDSIYARRFMTHVANTRCIDLWRIL